MHVSIPVGILIMLLIWSSPVLVVYLVHRFVKYREFIAEQNKLFIPHMGSKIEFSKYKTIKQVSPDGSRELTMGYEKEGF